MSKKRTYKSYTQKFKEEAVALVAGQGCRVLQVADFLSIGVENHVVVNFLFE